MFRALITRRMRALRRRAQPLLLEPLEARQLLAGDTVMFNDVGVGPNTNANTTSYVANGTASGLLRNVETGELTGITLTTSHMGAAFGTGGNSPLGSTDAATIFNDFVDFGSGTDSIIEIIGADSYTYTVSGLDAANRFDVAATAIRGNDSYVNRWTLVSIEGAGSFTSSHSAGSGIVTNGLAENQVAIWTGSNFLADQGFVAQWLDIDPGPDGEFEIVSQQYKGPTPGVGNGTASGIAGYAVSGFRLIEHDFDAASVSNAPAASVLATSAEIGATVTDTGGLDPTLTLYWGTNDGGTNPAEWDSSITFGKVGVGTYTETVTGLTSDTEYYYRAFAQNDAGSSWASSSTSFTTGSLSLPSLITNDATDVGAFSATLSGVVTEPGGDPPTVTIYYGETDGGTDAVNWDQSALVGERIAAFSTLVGGLSPETTYFFRAAAENAVGSDWAPLTRSFTTGDTPLLVISEFMANNNTTLQTRTRATTNDSFTGPQDSPDWIELQNLTGQSVDVGGMHLTDNVGDPNQWQFPLGMTVPANGYLVVFASGENTQDPALDETGRLHTNFSLNAAGEYVALTSVDGSLIHAHSSVPNQVEDISYGLLVDDARYFATPTPGSVNSNNFTELVADTTFSVDRGFFTEPFDVEITTATEGATIRFTLDGTTPSTTRGTVYSGPITFDATSTLRAIAYKPGLQPTNVDTQTYLFLNDVITQSHATTVAAGFPTSWNGTGPDYGLDTDVIGPNDDFGGRYAETIVDDLKALPTLSIVTDVNGVFGSNGIYSNPDNSSLEVPTSVEFFTEDGSEEFQINAGIKIQGGAFRSFGLTKKKSFRLKFKSEYGPAKLNYPLFGDDATDEFDTLTLRMEANDGWQWGSADGQPQYSRDEFGRRVQLAMAQPASHGRYTHVYINGVYWGMYNLVERPDQSFGEAYLGADKDDWDGINSGSPINADDDAARRNRTNAAWNTLTSLSDAVRTAATEEERTAAYMKVLGRNPDGSNNPNWETYLDAENMIDYFLVNWYGGNSDWPRKNYYVGRENSPDSAGFKFFMWDAEWSLFLRSDLNTNRINDGAGVAEPIQDLRASEEFRLLFADHVQQHLINPGGALYVNPDDPNWDPDNPENNVPASFYAAIGEEIFDGLVAESARWGDQHRSTPYTRDAAWQTEYNRIMNSWFPQRTGIFLEHLKNADLYTTIAAPTFAINGRDQLGGEVNSGDALSLVSTVSEITNDTVLVTQGHPTLALIPTDNSLATGAGPYWYEEDFVPAGWIEGTNGIGYEDNAADYQNLIGTDIRDQWNANETSIYGRLEFNLDAGFDAGQFDRLTLRMKYDDGFVAYLNGVEVASGLAPANVDFTARATGSRGDSTAATFVDINITGDMGLLKSGRNVLAVHGLNRSDNSSDMLVLPELVLSTVSSVDSAPVYYTTDGTDPRAIGGAIQGTLYTGEIPLANTAHIKARALAGGEWSALNETTFVVNPAAAGDLLISEINYNPAGPTAAELAIIGTLDNDDFEFLEVYNRGENSIEMLGLEFDTGIDFRFPAFELEAGQRAIIVRDTTAFQLRYGTDETIIGEFTDGSLSNGGEGLSIVDAAGASILDFDYSDNSLWPQRADGVGGTLELLDAANTPAEQLGKHYRWRGSVDFYGSPGYAGSTPTDVVINEVLAHTDPPVTLSDSIELFNTGTATVDLSGWFLSDRGADLRKYEIPAGTLLQPGAYVVFDESHFNPNPLNPGPNDFALSGAHGDDVWLVIPDGASGVAQFVDDVHFGATANGESIGRTAAGLVPQGHESIGCANSLQRVGPVVITEVNYNPGPPAPASLGIDPDFVEDDLEFVEIHNPTSDVVDLTQWRIRGGIELDFTSGTMLAAGESVVILSFNPDNPDNTDRVAAFRTHYGIDGAVRLIGGFAGQLSDSGEVVRLQRPDEPPVDEPGFIPRLLEDELIYDDSSPWAEDADGSGESLSRQAPVFFGSAATSWASASPSPGTNSFPQTTVGDFTGDETVTAEDIEVLATAVNRSSNVGYYDLDGNGTLDQADVTYLVETVIGTRIGDANLDGVVDGSDFNIWNENRFADCYTNWTQADFTGDGRTGGSDFNIWFANRFMPFAAASPVHAVRAPREAGHMAEVAETETRIVVAIIQESTNDSLVASNGTSKTSSRLSQSHAQTVGEMHDVALTSSARWFANVRRAGVKLRASGAVQAGEGDVRGFDADLLDAFFEDL